MNKLKCAILHWFLVNLTYLWVINDVKQAFLCYCFGNHANEEILSLRDTNNDA